MEPFIIATIISAKAAISAALIGAHRYKHKIDSRKIRFKKSLALRLGFIYSTIEFYVNAQKLVNDFVDLHVAIDIQAEQAQQISKTMGIIVDPDYDALLTNLPLILDKKPHFLKNTFCIGRIIGRVHFDFFVFFSSGSIPPNTAGNERLGEAEKLLRDADLPSNFLEPIKKLWQDTLQTAQKENFGIIDEKMEKALDTLCKSIDTNSRLF